MGANCSAPAAAAAERVVSCCSSPVFGEDAPGECSAELDEGAPAKEHKVPLLTRAASDASTAAPAEERQGTPRGAASDAFSVVSTAGNSTAAPAHDFGVSVTKNSGDGLAVKDDALGAWLGNTSKGAAIFCIRQGGLLDSWNQAAHPEELLRPGFVITEVNGGTGYWKVLEQLRKPGRLHMKVSTDPPESAGLGWFEEIAETGRKLEAQGGKSSYMLRLPCFFFEFCLFV